ncbi:MAG: TonB-dependent receptor, partial [Flavobacteriaceae bacterium]|nr:TonB-dependent receptor [Flavobacteriaceae bacterium]
MRYTLVVLFLACFLNVQAQENLDTFNLEFENKTIFDVIELIESQTDYDFFFIDEWLDNEKLRSGKYQQASINSILEDLFKDTLINYFVLERRIILTKNNAIHDKIPEGNEVLIDLMDEERPKPVFIEKTEATEAVEEEPIVPERIGKEDIESSQTKYTISGYVKDVDTGKPLANVAVSVRGKGIGTSTDESGFYKLELLPGNYTLVTNSLNTRNTIKRIVVYNDGEVNFNLKEKFEALSEVLVLADADRNVREVISGVTKIEVEGIKNIPLVLGERDLLKVAVTLPGIANTGEGSNGYNVRGGKTDQNLILLDNASIYNPSHLFGIFSAINPFTTGNVTIYKGNIPAEYGGRLSSVFDINTKDANTEKLSGEVSVGPVTSNVVLEVPIVKDKAAIMFGGRSTYSGWILRSLDEESLRNSEATFYDVQAKYNHKLNDNNSIKATAYYSKDRFSITSDSLYGYSNRLFSLGWQHKFNDQHNGELTLTNSEYKFEIEYDGDFNDDFGLYYKNDETELKYKLNFDLDDERQLTYGVSSKLYNIAPGDFEPLTSDSDIEFLSIQKEKGLESAAFVSIDYEINEKFALDAGLRYSMFTFLGPATQRIYQEGQPRNESTQISVEEYDNNESIETYSGLEGRLSARYFLSEDLSIKASYNNTFQYIHTLSTNTTVSP